MPLKKTPPIHLALMSKKSSEVSHALERGDEVDSLDRAGRTALWYAAMDGLEEIATLLIERGANVNAADERQFTPLHVAAREYRIDIAKLLLKHGAIVDAEDAFGNTPLSDAVFASRGRGEMIKLLLSHSADRTKKNHHGVSPESLANNIANYSVSQFLK